ncbi:MAG: hypothetical protein AABM67_22415 [Acidobacteriota bacterium]
MDKNELIQLAANRDLISGIYNYCDRWCERCPFTARCLVFATEKADGAFDDSEIDDINNAKFWQKLESTFKEVRQMIVEWAEEEGIDLEALEGEALVADREQQRNDAKQHPLSVAARDYAMLAQQWFENELAIERSVHDDTTGATNSSEEDIDVSDAIEVVRWYQFLVPSKIFRALMSFERDEAEPAGDDEMAEMIGNHSDGSAKIALIAIDRSLNAWRILQRSLPEKTDSILPMLVKLDRLRLATEAAFPKARDFIRPGFDEVSSEFVS